MKEASANLRRLAKSLYTDVALSEGFVEAILAGSSGLSAALWCRERSCQLSLAEVPRPPWVPEWVDLLEGGHRPGASPEHEQGDFYLLDAASIFMAAPLCQIERPLQRIIDCCASPGGKTVFAWRALNPAELITNEVIRKRTAQLISNLKRCRVPGAVISYEVDYLASLAGEAADLVLVDAPCSGQGLLARGEDSPGAMHPATINLNCNRQRRILANASKLVCPGGHLVYMTCTFSPKENEGVIEWFLKKFSDFEATSVLSLAKHQTWLSDVPMYRLMPTELVGGGGFTCLLRRRGEIEVRPHQIPRFIWER